MKDKGKSNIDSRVSLGVAGQSWLALSNSLRSPKAAPYIIEAGRVRPIKNGIGYAGNGEQVPLGRGWLLIPGGAVSWVGLRDTTLYI